MPPGRIDAAILFAISVCVCVCVRTCELMCVCMNTRVCGFVCALKPPFLISLSSLPISLSPSVCVWVCIHVCVWVCGGRGEEGVGGCAYTEHLGYRVS